MSLSLELVSWSGDPEDVKAASDVIGQVVCLLGGGALDAFVSSKRKMVRLVAEEEEEDLIDPLPSPLPPLPLPRTC